jgi:hypothetical protein
MESQSARKVIKANCIKTKTTAFNCINCFKEKRKDIKKKQYFSQPVISADPQTARAR